MGWRDRVDILQRHAVETFADDETFEVTLAGENVVVVAGIFRDAHTFVSAGGTTSVSTSQPTVDFRLEELPRTPRAGGAGLPDVVRALTGRDAGKTWRVVDVEPDGEGMAKLFLNLASGVPPQVPPA